MKWTIHRLSVDAAAAGQRLDQFLAGRVNEISRTAAKKIIDLGGVHVNGRRARSCSLPVKEGEQVEIYLDHLPLEPYRIAENQVIYQDRYLIVLNKPALIETQPTHARYKGTLFEALQVFLSDPFRRHLKPTLGMVQRLDRGTTGLIVFSIHPQAHRKLTAAILQHQLEKRYLALVSGHLQPDTGEIASLLARSRKENRVHSVKSGGKQALTRYQTAERWGNASLVEIELVTGRSHQIRAHMSEQDCPLLGDRRYGGPAECCGQPLLRPLLHASRLAFRHPVTEEALDFTAPVPEDMAEMITALRAAPNSGI